MDLSNLTPAERAQLAAELAALDSEFRAFAAAERRASDPAAQLLGSTADDACLTETIEAADRERLTYARILGLES